MKLEGISFNYFVDKLRCEVAKGLPGFSAQKSMSPSIREDLLGNNKPNSTTRQSAVLVPLFPCDNKIHLLFIKRPQYEGVHSGQVGFPGGKAEEIDSSIEQTALRETYEEVGICSSEINIIGTLTPLYIPISNTIVTPVIGAIEKITCLHPNLQEVDYIFSVPLAELLNPQNKSVKVISSHGRPITAPYYNVSNEMIWGATAMILAEFLEITKPISKILYAKKAQ